MVTVEFIHSFFKYSEEDIEIMNSFDYLGVVLSSNGSFVNATKTLTGIALKAMLLSSLLSVTRSLGIPSHIMLFDTYVTLIN